MLQRIIITGYKPHELGIFNDKHPGIGIIKKALEDRLRILIDEGLEWVIISGQQGVESWGAEVVLLLKKEYPDLKYAVITPFLEQEKNWQEHKKEKYQSLVAQADFVTSVTKKPYEAPWQFIEKDKFIIQNTDGLLLVYDDENEGSPKYMKRLAEKNMETHNYTLLMITAYDLQVIAEEMQQQDW
ncbi:SLOG family protein [Lysinibacillus sp. NPDC097231]|uniref:SLOG family protein n=1 Tax=Lysinibacillus sp. NPDC097231 TaxID=3364142 RepID=UPI003828B48A